MQAKCLVLVTAALLVHCASNGSANVDGTVSGVGLSASSAHLVTLPATEIIISSDGDRCADLQNDTKRKDTRDLVIGVDTVALGSFPITSASFQTFDDVCNSPIATTTTTGTITFTAVDQSGTLNISDAVNSASGTYDVTFGNDHVTGSFTAVFCTLSTLPDPTSTACK